MRMVVGDLQPSNSYLFKTIYCCIATTAMPRPQKYRAKMAQIPRGKTAVDPFETGDQVMRFLHRETHKKLSPTNKILSLCENQQVV